MLELKQKEIYKYTHSDPPLQKKLLEASGMVLQVTFFSISQSDSIKKISSHEEKKLDVKLN